MALFERGGKAHATNDDKGTIRLTIRLVGESRKSVKSNICRDLTINNAKVSEVSEAITEFLFGGDDE